MARSKYVGLIIGFIISIVTFVTIVILAELQKPVGSKKFIPTEYVPFFVDFLPGTLFTDLIFLYVIPIGLVLLFLGIGVSMATGLIKVHHLVHRGAKFGINPLGLKVSRMKLFSRTLFIGLFAFTITALLVDNGFASLFRNISMSHNVTYDDILIHGEAVFIGTFFISGILIILMLPFWLIEDSGIILYDVRQEERVSPNVSGIHFWFVDILEGYAGISAVISLVLLIVGIFSSGDVAPGDPAMLTPIILIFLPVITSGLLTIPIVIYEKYLPKMAKKLQDKLDAKEYPQVKVPVHDQVKVTENRS